MALASGTRLGPYEVLGPLGAGGMGEVYRARDTRLARDVAIKVLPAHLSANSDLKQRLDREAKAISSLNHPHICTLHDVGSQDGVDFLVMEHLEGETLADRLQRGPLPFDEALKIAIPIADALDKAHGRGIVHRDLKPANIMLTKHGVKLMDFGLAKPLPGMSASVVAPMTPTTPTMSVAALSADASPLTQKGTVVGTFQYMAPEVLQGAEAEGRADIFSFGCVLYEIFTGRRAFEGKSQFSVLGAILDHEPERISVMRPSSPARLDETVRRCLAKNPEQRYGCMHDVRIQLEALAEGAAQGAVVAKSGGGGWFVGASIAWMVTGIVVLAALGVGAAYLFRTPTPSAVVRSSILPPAGTSFVTMLPSSGPPAFSPDGTSLAFTARDEKGKVQLYVRRLNSLVAQALEGTDDAIYPFWSADSREIGFFAQGKLRKISASGGPPQTTCDAPNGRGGTWGPDGTIVFTPTTQSPLRRVSAAGGIPVDASTLNISQNENSHRWPSFLPDGKHFLFWARSSRGPHENQVYVGELGSPQTKALMKSDSMAVYASGHLLFLREQTLMAQPFDLSRLELDGDPVPITDRVGMNGSTAHPLFSVSQNGAVVYQSGDAEGNWDLQWVDRDGKQAGFAAPPDRYVTPSLSPDGSHLAVMIFNGAFGTGDVWVFDLARGTKTRLTFGPANQSMPVWTPDGKTVIYESAQSGVPHIYEKQADGSGTEKPVLVTSDGMEYPNSISPDGRYLIYERKLKSDAAYHLWVLPLFNQGKPFPIVQTTFEERDGQISPDGKWMAYRNNETGRWEIYITAFPGGGAKWQVSTNGGTNPRWRKDGRELYFLDPSENIVAVDVKAAGNAVNLGVPHHLFQALAIQPEYGPFDVTDDGKKFLLNSGNMKEGSAPFTLIQNWPSELTK